MRCFPRKVGATWHCYFECRGVRYSSSLRTTDEKEAEIRMAPIMDTLYRVERGSLEIPEGADVKSFIVSGGKATAKVKRPSQSGDDAKPLGLGELFDSYFKGLTRDAKAAGSIKTERIHTGHLRKMIGENRAADDLALDAIQKYVDRRARKVARTTILKEIATLRFVLRWAAKRGLTKHEPSWKTTDLTLPKAHERAPFQTIDQIEKQIARGGLSDEQQAELWECLWLDQKQTLECLTWVEANADRPFVLPMFAIAAYTGMRRGEIIRSEISDWDIAGRIVHCRGRKSDKSKSFTRRDIPIHDELAKVMKDWFADHPGGKWAIADEHGEQLTVNVASWVLRQTVDGGPWKMLPGWHCFRHSLASNMASAGTDARIINSILGHADGSDMERRYRHLLPSKRDDAIRELFS